jgi:hypothetical protein
MCSFIEYREKKSRFEAARKTAEEQMSQLLREKQGVTLVQSMMRGAAARARVRVLRKSRDDEAESESLRLSGFRPDHHSLLPASPSTNSTKPVKRGQPRQPGQHDLRSPVSSGGDATSGFAEQGSPSDSAAEQGSPSASQCEWNPNSHACERCSTGFGMTLFRHHCRRCGRNVCCVCAPADMKQSLPGYSVAVRQCLLCLIDSTGCNMASETDGGMPAKDYL